MTAGPVLTHIVGPAAWAPYLVNGDDSGLEDGEREKADAWLKREGVTIVGTEPGAESYFSWAGALYVPELGAAGFDSLDYRAREVRLEAVEGAQSESAAYAAALAAPSLFGDLCPVCGDYHEAPGADPDCPGVKA